MRVALCFSGHCRNFDKTYELIYKNMIENLEKAGYEIDIFVATNTNTGHRSEGWKGNAPLNLMIDKLKPKTISITQFNRSHFTAKYSSYQWESCPSLMGPNTPGDAVSMWNGVYNSWLLMDRYRKLHSINYDVIFRMRPDIIYTYPFDISILLHLKDNNIYMAQWHGKYKNVTFEMMDHFAFGTPQSMDYYMTLALHVDEYFLDGKTIHTGEGFLFTHLKNMDIVRVSDLAYDVQRKDCVEKVTTV